MRHCTKSCQRANDRATRRRNIGSHTGPHAQHRKQLQPKSYSAAAAATRTDGCRQTSYTLLYGFLRLAISNIVFKPMHKVQICYFEQILWRNAWSHIPCR